ncbi:MIP18 family protein [Penicillium maclennaniae]|uniref:MIP18 family protein n=1 Tax=Penicillium maclennaniae TaxID=1343394 RepID=UPI00253F8B2B|nr:MIP18 family protein [Penicillium maclennaniae]KAJ5677436.1 MIP18 family protein [Penicillium maclennaniae]
MCTCDKSLSRPFFCPSTLCRHRAFTTVIMAEMQNSNPTILNAADLPTRCRSTIKKADFKAGIFAAVANPADFLSSDSEDDDLLEEPIDEQEIYDLIKSISDPEHPLSLGELAVVSLPDIFIKPTLPNVPGSPLQTSGNRHRTRRSSATGAVSSPRYRVDVRIKEGTHSTGDEVNKQLGDKERVAAALENGALMQVIAKMMETCQ